MFHWRLYEQDWNKFSLTDLDLLKSWTVVCRSQTAIMSEHVLIHTKGAKREREKKRLNQRECGKNRRALTVFSQRKEKKKTTWIRTNINIDGCLRCYVPEFACVEDDDDAYVGDIMYTIARLSVRSSHLCQTEFEKK